MHIGNRHIGNRHIGNRHIGNRHIGNRTELFVDGLMADELLGGACLRLHAPKLEEVVLVGDMPWEQGPGYSSILDRGDGTYYLYYRGQGDSGSGKDEDLGQVTCVARSNDGIHFERMHIDRIECCGTIRNNVLLKGANCHNFTPFADMNPDCLADARFKAIAGIASNKNNGAEGGLYAYASPDGLAWRLLSERPVITRGLFDSQNLAFYDTVRGEYRCYSRYWDEGGVSSENFGGFRAIQSCTSQDFLNWTQPVRNEYGEPVTEHFYTNATMPCPGAEHILLSFPKRFAQTRKRIETHDEMGISEATFMASRDGVHWSRLFKHAWIRPGLDDANWTDRNMLIGAGMLTMPDGGFSLYMSEHNRTPDSRLRRVSVRRHGFVSLHADWDEGRCVSPALTFDPGALHLNFSTGASGFVRVWLAEADGSFAPDDAGNARVLYGDSLDEMYPLPELERFAGRPARLYFELKDADVYSFGFR